MPLGTASIVISGDEEGEVEMKIPVQPIINKPKTKKLAQRFKSRAKTKTAKYGYFMGDPYRKYYLDHASLRVGIQVIPEDAIKIAEERERHESDMKQMMERIGDENLEPRDQREVKKLQMEKIKVTSVPKRRKAPPTPPSILPFFCSAMMCAPSKPLSEPKVNDIPLEIIHTRTDLRYQYGVASIMSSVSESTDGSDESDADVGAAAVQARVPRPGRRTKQS